MEKVMKLIRTSPDCCRRGLISFIAKPVQPLVRLRVGFDEEAAQFQRTASSAQGFARRAQDAECDREGAVSKILRLDVPRAGEAVHVVDGVRPGDDHHREPQQILLQDDVFDQGLLPALVVRLLVALGHQVAPPPTVSVPSGDDTALASTATRLSDPPGMMLNTRSGG